LVQQTDQTMPELLACPTVRKHRSRKRGQAKDITEFTVGKQSCVGGDSRAMKLELQAAVELEAHRRHIGFTL
jgi:hypothetical protein